jgi:hypothetical protein
LVKGARAARRTEPEDLGQSPYTLVDLLLSIPISCRNRFTLLKNAVLAQSPAKCQGFHFSTLTIKA